MTLFRTLLTHRVFLLLLALSPGAMAVQKEAASPTTRPATLGTLFYSPTERAAVVAGRSEESAGPIQPSNGSWVSLKGLVKRDRQRGTAWVNGQAVHEGSPVEGVGVPAIGPKRITIDGKSLRVGESVDLESGARADVLPGDALRVRKAP